MTTQINGQPADWPADVQALWQTRVVAHLDSKATVVTANYFTPRPYVDNYNRGSRQAGFTYAVGREVYQATWIPAPDRCAICRHPARNHVPGRCRKHRCGCGGFVPPQEAS